MLTIMAMAQQPRKVYCEIVGIGNTSGTKVSKIEVDMGQNSKAWSSKSRVLVDEQNKKIEFNSMMDAVNYFSNIGWSFIQAYAVAETAGISRDNIYHYILCKEVTTDDQVKDGIKLKE